jgi:FdhE protein
MDFYTRVFQAQEEIRPRRVIDPLCIDSSVLEKKRTHAMPLIGPDEWVIDETAAARLLKIICDIAAKQTRELSDASAALKFAMIDERIDLKTLFDALLTRDDDLVSAIARTAGIHVHYLVMLTFLSIAPFIEVHAGRLASCLEKHPHEKGYCPVCGNFPDLFFLDENGSRHLTCGFCSHVWNKGRLGCVFCGNKDPETWQYFFSPDEKEYRVDVCDHCHRYVKGVDTRLLDRPFVPKMEQVATLHLDIKAGEAGYHSVSKNVTG